MVIYMSYANLCRGTFFNESPCSSVFEDPGMRLTRPQGGQHYDPGPFSEQGSFLYRKQSVPLAGCWSCLSAHNSIGDIVYASRIRA